MPARPRKVRPCSRFSGEVSCGGWGHARMAQASTRRALSAMALFAASTSPRSAGVRGTAWPPCQMCVQRRSTSSGAPLVYCTQPSAVLCTVLIILRMLSNGASPTRGASRSSAGFSRPRPVAQFTSAASVGSPTAAPVSSGLASLHRLAARAASASSPQCSTTVILFCVSVPVLSEHITCAQPSVSTAVRRRMTALRLDMLVTPMESTTVTTAASPSGMAATARLTATMKVDSTTSKWKSPARIRLNANTNTQMPSTSQVSTRLSCASFFCKGVWPSWAFSRAVAILPISVCMPVCVTTACPRPYTTVEPIYTMLRRSPKGTSLAPGCRASAPVCFSTGTLSPVRAASSTFRLALSSTRASAGTASPASSTTTSPGTSCSLFSVSCLPPRSTLLVAAVICCRASMAFSALLS